MLGFLVILNDLAQKRALGLIKNQPGAGFFLIDIKELQCRTQFPVVAQLSLLQVF